jgi:hypothetical protein
MGLWNFFFSLKGNIVYKFLGAIFPLLLLLSSGATQAHEYSGNNFVMFHPFAYPSQTGQALVPVYLRFISLTGPDKLIGAECRYADSVELRANQDLNEAAIPFIQLDEGISFDIDNPATPHILLKGIQLPFGFMRQYDMKLIFEKSGAINVTVSVGM